MTCDPAKKHEPNRSRIHGIYDDHVDRRVGINGSELTPTRSQADIGKGVPWSKSTFMRVSNG